MSRHGVAIALSVLACAAWTGVSRGDSFVERPVTDTRPVPDINRREHRDGLVVGMGGGFGFASSSGYPNSAQFIDVPQYHATSGLMTGSGGTFFIEGALADYLNFGFWFGGGSFHSADYRSTGGGGGFRVELFPLYVLVPSLRDLGVVAQLGLGSSKLLPTQPGGNAADGTQSFLGVGAFYEWTLFHVIGGHVAAGPSLDYDVITSRSIARGSALVGGRIAFYGGI